MKRVTLVITSIITNPNREISEVLKIREIIYEVTHYDIKEEGSIQIQLGILIGVFKLGSLVYSDLETLKAKIHSMASYLSDNNIWESMLHQINLHFILDVISIYSNHLSSINTILQQKNIKITWPNIL